MELSAACVLLGQQRGNVLWRTSMPQAQLPVELRKLQEQRVITRRRLESMARLVDLALLLSGACRRVGLS